MSPIIIGYIFASLHEIHVRTRHFRGEEHKFRVFLETNKISKKYKKWRNFLIFSSI